MEAPLGANTIAVVVGTAVLLGLLGCVLLRRPPSGRFALVGTLPPLIGVWALYAFC